MTLDDYRCDVSRWGEDASHSLYLTCVSRTASCLGHNAVRNCIQADRMSSAKTLSLRSTANLPLLIKEVAGGNQLVAKEKTLQVISEFTAEVILCSFSRKIDCVLQSKTHQIIVTAQSPSGSEDTQSEHMVITTFSTPRSKQLVFAVDGILDDSFY